MTNPSNVYTLCAVIVTFIVVYALLAVWSALWVNRPQQRELTRTKSRGKYYVIDPVSHKKIYVGDDVFAYRDTSGEVWGIK